MDSRQDKGAQSADGIRRIAPVGKNVMGNCHLAREVSGAIERGGSALGSQGSKYMEKMPRWAGWMEWGVGRR